MREQLSSQTTVSPASTGGPQHTVDALVSNQLAHLFGPHLEPGEVLVWTGTGQERADWRFMLGMTLLIGLFTFGLLGVAGLLNITFGAEGMAITQAQYALFLLYPTALTTLVLWPRRRDYGCTNRRVLKARGKAVTALVPTAKAEALILGGRGPVLLKRFKTERVGRRFGRKTSPAIYGIVERNQAAHLIARQLSVPLKFDNGFAIHTLTALPEGSLP